jgi:hypothetical protein
LIARTSNNNNTAGLPARLAAPNLRISRASAPLQLADSKTTLE